MAAALVAIVLAYLPGLAGPFLFDDLPNLVQNPLLRISGTAFDDWRAAALSGSAGIFGRPVAMFTFAAQHALTGDLTPLASKAVNLGIHLAIGLLAYLFCLRCLELSRGRLPRCAPLVAAVVAALWLAHPLQLSTVLHAVQRMAQLSTLFVLAGLCLYLRFRIRCRDGVAGEGEFPALLLWQFCLLLLAALSKENGVLLLPLLLLCELLLCRGIPFPRLAMPQRRLLLALAGCLLLAAACYVADALPRFLGGYTLRAFTLEERVLTQARVLWHYLSWLALPRPAALGLFHDDLALSRSLFEPLSTAVSLAGWGLVTAAAFVLRRRAPLAALAVGFFLVGHSLESTVLPLEMVYEHRNYLPSIGLLPLLAAALSRLLRVIGSRAVVAVCLGWLAVLVVLTGFRAQHWSSELSLMLANSQHHPRSVRAQTGTVLALLRVTARAPGEADPAAYRQVVLMIDERLRAAMALPRAGIMPVLLALQATEQIGPLSLAPEALWRELLQRVDREPIQASEWTLLQQLLICNREVGALCSDERLNQLVERAFRRNAGRVEAWRLRGHWLALSNASEAEQLQHLEAMLGRWRSHPAARMEQLALLARGGDIGAAYTALLAWWKADADRSHLSLMAALLDDGRAR